MLFRNEFRDLIETITIPFKPIRTEPVRKLEILSITFTNVNIILSLLH